MLDRLRYRYTEAAIPENLPGYQQPLHPWRRAVRNGLAMSALIVASLILGLLVSILPVFLYVYMAAPLGVLVLMVIWALPETGRYNAKFISTTCWAFFISLFVWPNYLAIDAAGLPWITVQRLFLIPLAFVFLIGLSQARKLREKIVCAYHENTTTFRLFIAFTILQSIVVLLSPTASQGFNKYVNNQLVWTLLFLATVTTIDTVEKARKWALTIVFLCMILTVIAFLEVRNQGVLWADHIPSFLQVAGDEGSGPMASAYRRASNLYRVKGTFANPLLLAEIMGLATPFILYAITSARSGIWRLLFIAYLPFHFMAIRFTDGRLGAVAFFASIMIYGLVWGIRYWRSGPRNLIGPSLVIAYPVAAFLLVVAVFTWTPLYRAVFGGGAQAASNDGRAAQWAAAIPKLQAWPFGNGPGSSGEILGFVGANGVLTVDSYYITLLLEYGVLGFIIYFWMFGSGAASAIKRYLTSDGYDVMLPLAVMMLVYIIDKSVLSLELIHPLLFMALAIIVALNTPKADEEA